MTLANRLATIKFSRLIMAISFVFYFVGIFSCQASMEESSRPQQVVALPGKLDKIPVFNSNSPEVVLKEGILLSTFPSKNKRFPKAHLPYSFKDRFDIFAHHIAHGVKSGHMEDLYIGVLVFNPGSSDVKLEILQAASYLSQPDAPFVSLSKLIQNSDEKVYAGPGDRVTTEFLHGKSQPGWPKSILVPAHTTVLLTRQPIPVSGLKPPLNGRSLLIKAKSSGPVHLATVAKFASADGTSPADDQLIELVSKSNLVSPRDIAPTPPNKKIGLKYGRVAGVSIGSAWNAILTDEGCKFLSVPSPGEAVSYPVSTVAAGAFGTGQIQSAPMAVRYPDTAYAHHGNYCVTYNLKLPLKNNQQQKAKVRISLDCPVKTDVKAGALKFLVPPSRSTFFRGTIKTNIQPGKEHRYHHVVLHKGEQGAAFEEVTIEPDETKTIEVTLMYPPDCTPPQVLSITALSK